MTGVQTCALPIYPSQLWAEPDPIAAAGMLRGIRDNAGELGERARTEALRRFSAEAYTASVRRFFASANGIWR